MGPPDDVAGLRSRLRVARRGVGPEDRAHRAQAAAELVTRLPWWATVRRVAVYRAVDGELDPTPVMAAASAAGATVHVPVLDDDELRFAAVDDTTSWAPNRFGIAEPVDPILADGRDLDLVLVPVVGVDPRGNRLGMGAGYYDRTFAWLRLAERPADTVLVAFAHDEQVVDALDARPWDVPMDAIVTPTRIIRPDGSN